MYHIRASWGEKVDIGEDVWRFRDGTTLSMDHHKHCYVPYGSDEVDAYEEACSFKAHNFRDYMAVQIETKSIAHVRRVYGIMDPFIRRGGPDVGIASEYSRLLGKLHAEIIGGERGRGLLAAHSSVGIVSDFWGEDLILQDGGDGDEEFSAQQASDLALTLATVARGTIDPRVAVAALIVIERGYTCDELARMQVRHAAGPYPLRDHGFDLGYAPTIIGGSSLAVNMARRNEAFEFYGDRAPNDFWPLFQSPETANGCPLNPTWFQEGLSRLDAELTGGKWLDGGRVGGWPRFRDIFEARNQDRWLALPEDARSLGTTHNR